MASSSSSTSTSVPAAAPASADFMSQLVNAVAQINSGAVVLPKATTTLLQGRTKPEEHGFAGGVVVKTSEADIENYRAAHGIKYGYIQGGDFPAYKIEDDDVNFIMQRTIDERGIRIVFEQRMAAISQELGCLKYVKKNTSRIVMTVCYGYWGRNKLDGTGVNVYFRNDADVDIVVDITKKFGIYTGTPNDDTARDVSVLTLPKIARIFVLEAYSSCNHPTAVRSPIRLKTAWKNEADKQYVQIQGHLLALRVDKTGAFVIAEPAERAACLAINFDRSYRTCPDDIRKTLPGKFANLIQLAKVDSKTVYDLIKTNGGGKISKDVEEGWTAGLYT